MRDIHSFARPDEAVVKHLALDLTVDFTRHQLSGSATLQIEHRGAREIVLDSNGLSVGSVTLDDGTRAKFSLGEIAAVPRARPHHRHRAADEVREGRLPDLARCGRGAMARPAPDGRQEHPFLFTQSQAIHARPGSRSRTRRRCA